MSLKHPVLPPEAVPAPQLEYPRLYDSRDELSLAGIAAMLRRRRRLIAVTGLLAALATALALLSQPAQYEATALVMVDSAQQRVLDPEQSLSEATQTNALVDSEVERLRSRDMAARLTEALSLRKEEEFNPSAFEAVSREPDIDRVPDRVAGAFQIARRGATNVIEITARSDNAAQAARLANGMVDVYLQSLVDLGVGSTNQADAWLQQRLAELRRDIAEKEVAVDEYRAEHGLLEAQGATLAEQQIVEAQAAVLAARGALAESRARQRQVRAAMQEGASPDAIAAVINSNVIRDLRGREADIARQQADMLARYGDAHPKILNNQAELKDIRAQLKAEMQRIASSLESEVDVAATRLGSLQADLGALRNQLISGNHQSIELRQLEREAAAARSVYESFLQRSHEISEQGALNAYRARPLSAAVPPSHDNAPSFALIAFASLIIGATVGFSSAAAAQMLDGVVRSADDAQQATGLPVVASIPELPNKVLQALPLDQRHPARYTLDHPHSAFAEAVRVVRASIMYPAVHAGTRVVAITSALPGEGKTTLSLSLARMSSISGERVLLIDCDVRRRSVNDLLNIAPSSGLVEVLSGRDSYGRVLGRDEPSGAHVLPISTAATPLEDLIGSKSMRSLLNELSHSYDLIILDCPPILAVAQTRALVSLADVVLLVGRSGKTHGRALANAVAQVRASGAEVSGIALNRADPRESGRSSFSDTLYYSEAERAYYHA